MSWPLVKIGDVCSLMTGGTPKTTISEYYEDGTVPWIVSGDIHKGEIFDCDKKITELAVENSNARYLPKDSVLIALNGQGKTRGTVALLRASNATCNQSIVSINPNDQRELFSDYLFYFLKSQYRKIRNITGDKDRAGLNMPLIRSITIPLPPLEEQKRIAAILDKADSVRRKRLQAIDLADDFLCSVFLDMFGDPVTNPKGWKSKNLGDLCAVGSSKRVFVDDFVESGIPFYRGTEVGKLGNSEQIDPSLFISQEHYQALKEHGGVPQIGDLLLPSICPDGRIWQVDHQEPFYFKDGRVLWIKSSQTSVSSDYLRSFLQRIFFANYNSIASGTTFAELKIVALKNIDILLPPDDLQIEYSQLMEKAVGKINKQLIATQEQVQLFNSLSQKAFAGEL